ncbi:MAG TPA: hypothetical protein VL200_16555 [Lacunisphaera sp.]|jgi:hypothetical protein|nr:hypothetical protein [Lacunisphaera sp.]
MKRTLAPIAVLLLALLPPTAAFGAAALPAAAQGKDSLGPKAQPAHDAGAKDPTDFPRPPGLVRQGYSQDPGKLRDTEIATYHTGAAMDDIAGNYLERLATASWRKGADSTSGSDSHRVRIIEWTMPAKEAEIRFYAIKAGGTDVRVRIFTYKTEAKAAGGNVAPATATPTQAAATNVAATSKATGAAPLGPPPTNFKVSSNNPYAHQLSWSCETGTTNDLYRVLSTGTTQLLAGTQDRSYSDDAFLEPNTIYRVVVHYPDGRQGSLDYTYANPPQPAVVTGLKAVQTGPNKVNLRWDDVPPAGNNAAKTYQVSSPTTAIINQRLTTNKLVAYGIPVGNHWVRVAVVYDGARGQGVAPKEASANFDVLTDRGRYRVTFLGVECVHETKDDMLQLDGKRDEIFAGAYVATVARNQGLPKNTTAFHTKVMGDTNGFPDRIRAGTASDQGGIQTGDFVPDSSIKTPYIGVKGTTDRFPLAVWEGELVDNGDIVTIAPTVFEWDKNDDGPWNTWVGWWKTPRGEPGLADAARNPIKGDQIWSWLTFTEYLPPNKDNYAAPVHYGPFFDESGANRPIGLYDQAAGLITAKPVLYWQPWGMVLTRMSVEKALGTQNAVVIPYSINDAPETLTNAALEGQYTLYIQLERLGTPPPPVAPQGGGTTAAPSRPDIATATPAQMAAANSAGLSKATGAAPAGPPPTNIHVQSVNAASHDLDWSAANWSSFDIFRVDSKGSTQIAASLNALKFRDHAFLEPHTIYRINVHHTDGSVGSADYDYAQPPVAPTPLLLANQNGAGVVKVSWVPVQGVNGYQLYGPTLPPDGKFFGSGTDFTVTGLAVATYEFRLAAVFSDAGTLYPAPNQAKTSITLRRVVDRYRVTLLGVQCVHETTDDMFQVDGKRDEIFAGASVATLSDEGPLTYVGSVRTKVMGDTNGFPDRIRAGSASDKGGIQTGDYVPDSSITTAKPGVVGSTDRFPLTMWEGELSDTGGLVIVAPILFEWDKNDDGPWNDWTSWWTSYEAMTQAAEPARLSRNDTKQWATILTKTFEEKDSDGYAHTAHLGIGYHASGENRPVGVEDQANIKGDPGFFNPNLVYVPKGMCLSHAKVEAVLGSQNTTLIPWYADDGPTSYTKLDGQYILYIQIERLAPPKQTGSAKMP